MSQYVVVDLEMCTIKKENRTPSYPHAYETIQIGAVLVDEQYEIVDTFNTYVYPEYGFLSNYIKELTGIKSKDLVGAPNMLEALERFMDWVPKDAYMVSWSNTDMLQIKNEAKAKSISDERLKPFYESWIDCQKLFSDKIQEKRAYRLSDALIMADILQEGKEHDGLSDAYNTAKLFAKIMREPEFKLNKYIVSARFEQVEPLKYTLAYMFKKLQLS